MVSWQLAASGPWWSVLLKLSWRCVFVNKDYISSFIIYINTPYNDPAIYQWCTEIKLCFVHRKGTFTLCPCQNQFQCPLQFPCPSHRLHWIRIPVSFRLNFMSTTASPDVKVWFCIGTCKIRIETDVHISFSRSGVVPIIGTIFQQISDSRR